MSEREVTMNRPRLGVCATLIGMLLVACASPASTDSVAQPPAPRNDPAAQQPLVPPNGEPYVDNFFENPGVNPRIDTRDDRLSTFALDVDTASYTVARAHLADGNLPDRDSVRVEEFVNAFPTGRSGPETDAFSVAVDGGPTPYVENERYQVARVTIASRAMAVEARPDTALTFVIDVSGSMAMESRLELVKRSLEMLVDELRPSDTIAIVVYGSTARIVLPPTPVIEGQTVRAAIGQLQPEGSTNAEAGLVLGYEVARAGFRPGGVNRVILASDGVANVGNTGADAILAQVRTEATAGITMLALGVGMGNFNDVLLERLANDGDGFYVYIDTLAEAERLFRDELTSTLVTVALDAKVQIDFDPATVESYRLIGFENRDVADDRFRDDSVDAGAIGAGHHVTALYELRMLEGAAGTLGTVHLRWTDPLSGLAQELKQPFGTDALASGSGDTAAHFRLATTVAAFGEVLRDSVWADGVTLEQVAVEAAALSIELGSDPRVPELAELIRRAASLAGD
ncbi:MAG: YfbK domain-containing protein [Candidatus Limnocylindria bacterium]